MALRSPEVPRTYAQWSACLDVLSAGTQDEACLDVMRRGDLAWSGGVATLFAQRLADEFNTRLSRCSDWLTRDLRQGSDESLIVRAVLNARQGLRFLHRLAMLDVFPATLRTHLSDEVRKFAQRSQQSLEDSAKTDHSGRLLVLLRNNTLLRYEMLTEPASAGTPASMSSSLPSSSPLGSGFTASPSSGTRRRNILS